MAGGNVTTVGAPTVDDLALAGRDHHRLQGSVIEPRLIPASDREEDRLATREPLGPPVLVGRPPVVVARPRVLATAEGSGKLGEPPEAPCLHDLPGHLDAVAEPALEVHHHEDVVLAGGFGELHCVGQRHRRGLRDEDVMTGGQGIEHDGLASVRMRLHRHGLQVLLLEHLSVVGVVPGRPERLGGPPGPGFVHVAHGDEADRRKVKRRIDRVVRHGAGPDEAEAHGLDVWRARVPAGLEHSLLGSYSSVRRMFRKRTLLPSLQSFPA